jgi:hypothetical protein
MCIGLRIDLAETSLGSVEDLCAILDDIRADTSHRRSRTIGDLCASSLRTNFDHTEFHCYESNYDKFTRTFGGFDDKDDCYLLFFEDQNILVDHSNGDELNTGWVYSSGHVEFYHGHVSRLDPTADQVDLFQEIARRADMGYGLSWSLRSRGNYAPTVVWPPHLVRKDD